MHASPTPLLVKVAPLTIHTPLTVMAASPLPVSAPTPLHVRVDGGLPDWVGYLTLFIAVVTLVAVLRQIKLAKAALQKANEQLEVANAQLTQGAKEIELVRDDLAIQREQNEEFRKRPSLLAKLTVTSGRSQLRIHIANVGQRTSRNYRLRVYFPSETNVPDRNALRKTDFAPTTIAGAEYFILDTARRDVSNEAYLYAGDSKYAEYANFDLGDGVTVLWDADDEAGHYPKKRFGAIHIAADLRVNYVPLPDEIEAWAEREQKQSEGAAQAEELAGG